jgi:hypothetical protein
MTMLFTVGPAFSYDCYQQKQVRCGYSCDLSRYGQTACRKPCRTCSKCNKDYRYDRPCGCDTKYKKKRYSSCGYRCDLTRTRTEYTTTVQCRLCGDRYAKGAMHNCRNTQARCSSCDRGQARYGYQCDLSSRCSSCGTRYATDCDYRKSRCDKCSKCNKVRKPRRQYQYDTVRCGTCDRGQVRYGYQCDLSSRCSSCGTRYAKGTACDCGKIRCKTCGVDYQRGIEHHCRKTTDRYRTSPRDDAPRTAWHEWFRDEGNPL